MVVVPIVASLVIALVVLVLSTVDAWHVVLETAGYVDPALDAAQRARLHAGAISHIAATVDGYLFATVLIIFALGLYELFIGKIQAAERSEVARRLLLIRSIDDLKDRLAKSVFLILIVRYFQFALASDELAGSPLDLLYLALGIALIGLALYLTSRRAPRRGVRRRPESDTSDTRGASRS